MDDKFKNQQNVLEFLNIIMESDDISKIDIAMDYLNLPEFDNVEPIKRAELFDLANIIRETILKTNLSSQELNKLIKNPMLTLTVLEYSNTSNKSKREFCTLQ